jgi:hypothetical protein
MQMGSQLLKEVARSVHNLEMDQGEHMRLFYKRSMKGKGWTSINLYIQRYVYNAYIHTIFST